MATNIVLTDLTNGTLNATNEWTGSGVFDKLIEAVNKNIEGQYNLGRINATDYATVYLGGMQSVIQESMQYILQEKQVEAQTDLVITQNSELLLNGVKDRVLKDKQAGEIEAKTQLTVDQDNELLANGVKDRLLKDEQLLKLQEEVTILKTQDSETKLNGIATRKVKAKDELIKVNQADLLVRQQQALNDSLLKDLFKEASGGYAMVYTDKTSAVAIPAAWSHMDKIANQLLTNAGAPTLNAVTL